MAWSIYEFAVTISAGTPITSPQVTNMSLPPIVVQSFQILVPPGPRGTVGFQIGAAGGQIFPHDIGTYIITDDEKISWDVENTVQSGAWQLIGYNTGSFNHTIYVRFLTVPITVGAGSQNTLNIVQSQNLAGSVSE